MIWQTDDSMELNILEEVFCTRQRKTPLKVGSVKSNIGHCDVSGHFVSIVKAIIALDGGYIPPNINYTEPNENIKALKTGKIQVSIILGLMVMIPIHIQIKSLIYNILTIISNLRLISATIWE